MSNILIERDFALLSIAKNRAKVMEIGNEETDERMAYYNPSSFLAGFDYGMELAQKILSSLPTAYNVSKVVERLASEMYFISNEQGECFEVVPFYKVIEIVTKGGVE